MSTPELQSSSSWRWRLRYVKQRLLKAYADWRVGATRAEKRCHKPTDSILLTFDDYGTAEQVHDILNTLRTEKVQAMFFLQGDWVEQEPDLVRHIAEQGHLVGNHTYSHPDLLSLSDKQVLTEIANGPASQWLRPPRGRFDRRIRRLAASLGYRLCYWTIDSDDWQGTSATDMERKILSELHPGAVVLFHIHGTHTRQALRRLIPAIRKQGYVLTSPNERAWEGI
jgi:peptidoglycan/xylan/chitin deacetylase (PgdA/CDA1 family)